MLRTLIITLASLGIMMPTLKAHAGDGVTPLPHVRQPNVDQDAPEFDDADEGPEVVPPQQTNTVVNKQVIINNYYNQAPDQYVAPGYGLPADVRLGDCSIDLDQNGIPTLLAYDYDGNVVPLWSNDPGPQDVFLNGVIDSLQTNFVSQEYPRGICGNFGIVQIPFDVDLSGYNFDGGSYVPRPYGWDHRRALRFFPENFNNFVAPRFLPNQPGFDRSFLFNRRGYQMPQGRMGYNGQGNGAMMNRGLFAPRYSFGGRPAVAGGGGPYASVPGGGQQGFRMQQMQEQQRMQQAQQQQRMQQQQMQQERMRQMQQQQRMPMMNPQQQRIPMAQPRMYPQGFQGGPRVGAGYMMPQGQQFHPPMLPFRR